MPIIKSAKKRVRQSSKAASRNRITKRLLKSAVKSLHAKASEDNLKKAQSAIDTAVKKGILHKNKGARKKAQLAAAAKASGLKLSAKKAVAKKAPAKSTSQRTAAKKTPAKKPSTSKK